MSNVYVAILAGGAGTRLWPLSTTKRPKQFLDILGNGQTLLQASFERALKLSDKENVLILTNKEYRTLVKQQLPDLLEEQIITEPARRNTAACIAYAGFKLAGRDPDGIMVVMPSDHLVSDLEGFTATVERAMDCARGMGGLMTIGIVPDSPHTGYGYIERGAEMASGAYEVQRFVEKPDEDTAKKYIASGAFYWNSGIFVWQCKALLAALAHHAPALHKLFFAGSRYYNTNREADWIDQHYSDAPSISIDYAVMEKATNVGVVPSSFGWSDLGSWDAIYDQLVDLENGNVHDDKVSIVANGKAVYLDQSIDSRPVVINGLENVVIVQTPEVIMLTSMSRLSEIKQLRAEAMRKFNDNLG